MSTRFHVVIPAAGVGARMGYDTPKQYLPLVGRVVIEWAIASFLAREDVAEIVVAVSHDDARFSSTSVARESRVKTAIGGSTRAESVLRGLQALRADENDWVLVHDAARPCLDPGDLARLIDECAYDDVGGLLAVPVVDTLKSADESARVSGTISRNQLWRAQTPQMFRYGLLLRALRAADRNVTDESMAVEQLGLRPKLVMGRADNIKITVPEDALHAEHILRQRNSK